MFSSRNIHFAMLGIILGGSAGYVGAIMKAQSSLASIETSAVPSGHPEVSDAQMLDAFKKALAENPNQPELITRYAMTLFNMGREAGVQGQPFFSEAETWFAKAIQLTPTDLSSRSMHGVVLWELGRKQEAETELETALKQDPGHVPSLHGLLLLSIEKNDKNRASQLLQQIQKVEPGYEGLPGLRSRFEEVFGKL